MFYVGLRERIEKDLLPQKVVYFLVDDEREANGQTCYLTKISFNLLGCPLSPVDLIGEENGSFVVGDSASILIC